MTKSAWKLFVGLMIVVSLICGIIQWQFMTGYLLGCGASALVYMNTVHYVDKTIAAQMPSGTVFHMAMNYMIWIAVLVLSAVLPQYLNVLFCALGLFMIRISLIIDELWQRKRV